MGVSVTGLLRMRQHDLSSETGRSNERFRRAALATLASAAAKVVALAANLISVPLTLSYLGTERFGLWVTISSANALLEFADLGLGNGLLNVVASSSSGKDRPALRRSVSSATFLLVGISLLMVSVFAATSHHLPWDRFFGGSARIADEARAASAAFLLTFACSLPLGLVRRVQMGFQEGFQSNLWQCLGSILSLAALLMGIRMKAGLPVLVLCLTGGPALALALNWIVEFRVRRRWLMPSVPLFNWHTGTSLIHSGLLFVTLQIGSLSQSAVDPLIAAHCLGLSATADFAVAQRLFTLVVALQGLWLLPLWPAYGEAAARGDSRWVRRTLYASTLAAFVTSALLGCVLVVFRGPIFSTWLHRNWSPPVELVAPFALCTVVMSIGMATAMYLNGVDAIREQAGVAVVLTIVTVALKFLFCNWFGLKGIPWALLVAYTAIMGPFLFVIIRRRLRVLQPTHVG